MLTFRSSGGATWRPSPVGAVAAALAACLAGERERWALWSPAGIAVGIAFYFALSFEPPLWLGPAFATAAAAAAVAAWRARRGSAVTVVALAAVLMATGFAAAQLRTAMVAAPMLGKRLGPISVSGRVQRVEALNAGMRVTVAEPRVPGLTAEETPRLIRIRLGGSQPQLRAGDALRVRAVLLPPPAPAAPGAFDFQRRSFYRGLGAVGYGLGSAAVVSGGEADGFWQRLAWLRHRIGEDVRGTLGAPTGAVTAALMTGEREAIPAEVMAAIRNSGLAHLLAISGLHIGLVAGVVFAGVRGLLALIPPLALRYPIKKWAALTALPAAGAYMLLAGATVPSQRAFLMIALVLVAVLLDRRGLSMRAVAWAAAIILLAAPESLLSASFQLSFAAVTALIAFYEAAGGWWHKGGEPPLWRRRVLFYVAGVALTTVIATAATAPFAVFHFNRIAAYGLAANLIAVPITALWVMPWAVVAFVLMPLGLERLALTPMGWGVEGVIRVAESVASWPGAVALVPAMPTAALVAITAGGLWLCLWRRRWRLWGTAGLVAGAALMISTAPPDLLIDGRGKLIAVRDAAGALRLSSLRASSFARKTWLRRNGQPAAAEPWSPADGSDDGRLACDRLGCLYRVGGRLVAIARRAEALAEDCAVADVVVSTVPVRRACPAATIVVDRFDLWRGGTHALWLAGGRVWVESVNARRGARPWVIRPSAHRGHAAGQRNGKPNASPADIAGRGRVLADWRAVSPVSSGGSARPVGPGP